ncbi:hypothetical protein [Bradyrhizobium erythrophlei]|uniref:Uncharacterized protein n=1 Tax=Bradyrhizobium erythrophlei TaxID=1437360 RepID=A0A1M5TAH7_9BRAD|nr:hypothetical protein [Bradyrhizobium erythrophlei]SHH47724.1 hypothetical protein SAMN05444169_7646 [Bradyrhizobium erythrophlei]
MIDLDKLRDISALLTRAANAPMDTAYHALHNARLDLHAVILHEERRSLQKIHGERVEARQKQANTYLNGEAELQEWKKKNPGKECD